MWELFVGILAFLGIAVGLGLFLGIVIKTIEFIVG